MGALSGRGVTAIAISMAVVVGCGGGAGTPAAVSSPTSAAVKTSAAPTATPAALKVRASYGNVTPANLAPFFAKDQGMFLKHGLDVDLSLIGGGSKSMAALLGNSEDIAQLGGTETMSASAGGADVVCVALFVPVSPWTLLGPASYTSPADLKGKTIGVATRGGSAEVAAAQALATLGLKPTDVSIQATGSTANLTAALIAGQVYAGPGHPPDTSKLFAAGFKVIVDLAKEKVVATDNGTIVTRTYLTAHRDVVQKYVDSLVEAVATMKKDKATTLKVMEKLLKVTDQQALSETYDFYVTQIFPVYPVPDEAAFKASRDDLAATTPTLKGFDVTKILDRSFVDDAKKRNVGGG
ncbi:MAG: ABC transporter substrate-binding protein [Candidatus Limnocylindrales bacterium]